MIDKPKSWLPCILDFSKSGLCNLLPAAVSVPRWEQWQLSPGDSGLNLSVVTAAGSAVPVGKVWCRKGKGWNHFQQLKGRAGFTFVTWIAVRWLNPPSPCTYSSLCNNWWLRTWSAAPSRFPAACCSCQCHRQPGPPARWRRSWAGPPHCCSSLQTAGSSHQTSCSELLPSAFWVFSASSGLGAPSTWPGASSALGPSGNRMRLCQRKRQRTQQVRKIIPK